MNKKYIQSISWLFFFGFCIWLFRLAYFLWYPLELDAVVENRSAIYAIERNVEFLIGAPIALIWVMFLLNKPIDNQDENRGSSLNIHFFLPALVVFVLVVSINFFVNPWGLFPHTGFDPRIENSRKVKSQIYLTLDYSPEIVLLGTSRSFGISSKYLENQTGLSAFNGALFSGSSYDELIFTKFLLSQDDFEPPNLFMIEIHSVLTPDLNASLVKSPYKWLPYMDSNDQFEWWKMRFDNLFSVGHLAEGIFITRYRSLYPDYQANWQRWEVDEFGDATQEVSENYESIIQNIIDNNVRFKCNLEKQIDNYNEIVSIAEELKIPIVFYTIPYNPRYFDSHLDSNESYLDCLQVIDEFILGAQLINDQVTYINLDDFNRIDGVTGAEGFFDHQHITNFNADRVVDKLAIIIKEVIDR